jgi:hypothetical protein
MTPGMVTNRDFRAGQVPGFENVGISRHDNGRLTNAIGFSPHHPLLDLRSLVDRPMAGTAHVSRLLALASLSFGIALEGAEQGVLDRRS